MYKKRSMGLVKQIFQQLYVNCFDSMTSQIPVLDLEGIPS